MDKNFKKNRAAKAKAEEEALSSILCWVAGGSVLEFLLVLLNRYWSHYGTNKMLFGISEIQFRANILGPGVKVLAFLLLAAAAGAACWWKRKGMKTRLPLAVSLVTLGASAGCFAAWLVGESGLVALCTIVPVVVVLAILYYLYQREFFLLACQSALALLGIWMCDRGLGGGRAIFCWIYVIAAMLLVGASAWVCSLLQRGRGAIQWKGREVKLLSREANYPLLYVGAAVSLAILACALMSLPTMALYAVAVAWLLVMAVYYTVKLM